MDLIESVPSRHLNERKKKEIDESIIENVQETEATEEIELEGESSDGKFHIHRKIPTFQFFHYSFFRRRKQRRR